MNITSIKFHCSRNIVLSGVTLCESDDKVVLVVTSAASEMIPGPVYLIEQLLYSSEKDGTGSPVHQK